MRVQLPCRLTSVIVGLAAALLALLMLSACAYACDIPVYQYTMQAWERDSYEVIYVYKGTHAGSQRAVNERLRNLARGRIGSANIDFSEHDLAGPPATDPGLRAALLKHQAKKPPYHIVLTPKKADLHAGTLGMGDISPLIASAKRTELARQLAGGVQGGLVLLRSGARDADARAAAVVNETVTSFARQDIRIGRIAVDRTSQAEKWLVRQLLAVEGDLVELHEPMVFGVFGRGHALEPYVGAGITEANLTELIEFINGPCACEIKTTSAGMDLLTDFKWPAELSGVQVAERPLQSALFDVGEQDAPSAAKPTSTATPSRTAPSAPSNAADGPQPQAELDAAPTNETPMDIGALFGAEPSAPGGPPAAAPGPPNAPAQDGTVAPLAQRRGLQPPDAQAAPACFSGGPPAATSAEDMRAEVSTNPPLFGAWAGRVAAVLGIGLLLVLGAGTVILLKRRARDA